MEAVFEILFEFIAELVLQGVFGGLVEGAFRTLAAPFQSKRPPWLSAIGHLVWGAIAGGISLLIFPHSFLRSETLRLVNLAATPLIAAFCIMQVGRWRAVKADEALPLDRFASAFVFALTMAAVRYFWTT